MDEEELRIKIYERLGLELGSLTSESGNDWIRAEKEILFEYRQEQLEKILKIDSINCTTINKDSEKFLFVLNTDLVSLDNDKLQISKRQDLSDLEIKTLIKLGSKDVLINIAREQKLSDEQITMIIPKSVYLVKKYLIEDQDLSASHQESLIKLMNEHKDIYKNLIAKLKD
ncbi:MAG: hypothetical protein M0R46_16315 [Candidatus Muirbacterium halophilum]|nr:hypothetical protein [Candidatus Muirbacterium halophilum]